ncbi:unnamed protein product [Calypogeia fissa]
MEMVKRMVSRQTTFGVGGACIIMAKFLISYLGSSQLCICIDMKRVRVIADSLITFASILESVQSEMAEVENDSVEIERVPIVVTVPEAERDSDVEIVSVVERPLEVESECEVVEADDMLYVDDIEADFMMDFAKLPDVDLAKEFILGLEVVIGLPFWQEVSPDSVVTSESNVVIPFGEGSSTDLALAVTIPGLRALPDPNLVEAGRGEERQPTEHNDKWAMRRADSLRDALKWDMRIPLGDLSLSQLDELLSHLFSRAVKVDGNTYPSSTLMNLMNCYNRIVRRSSELRAVKGLGNLVDKDFNINNHPSFTKTRMVLRAAIKKSAKDGVNKRRNKVEILKEEHEKAILADVDHQIYTPQCQKRLAFYCLVRLGIRGGLELYELQRQDFLIQTDKEGREFVRFEERCSKNNNYTLERYNEEQFRKVFHSYEEDFVITVKQYLRHMPPEDEGTKPDLFLGPITNPTGNIWFNRVHKVSQGRASKWLRTMLELVGLAPDLFSNRSGRATLITRMAARGVPDDIGMLISGHHTADGYSRYDRTQALKMQAVAIVSANPDMSYEDELMKVSKKFISEDLIRSSANLKPLIVTHSTNSTNSRPTITEQVQPESMKVLTDKVSGQTKTVSMGKPNKELVKIGDWGQKCEELHKDYDGINWEEEMGRDARIAEALGGMHAQNVSVGSSVAGNQFTHCTINFHVVQHKDDGEKENSMPKI